jgi:hypothetical protein
MNFKAIPGEINMILQEDKIILDDGLEFEFGENFEDVKSKYDGYDSKIIESEEYKEFKTIFVYNVEAFGYKCDLRIAYQNSRLFRFIISFHMPSKLGQTFDTREEFIEANKAFYRKVMEDARPFFSELSTTEFREDEYGIFYQTKKYKCGFGIGCRDFESVSLGASSLTLY